MSESELLETGSTREVLGELFVKINGQEKAQARTDSELLGIKQSLGTLAESVKEIAAKINKGTDWNLVWAALGVVIIFCGGMGTLVTLPMSERIAKLEKCRDEDQAAITQVAVLEERSRWMRLAMGIRE